MNRIKRIALYAGLSQNEFNDILKNEVAKENRHNMIVFSLFVGLLFGMLSIVGFVVPSQRGRGRAWLYLAIAVVSVVMYILSRFRLVRGNVFRLCGCLFASILLLIGIYLGVYIQQDNNAVVFHALLLLIPQVYTEKPLYTGTFIVGSSALFICFALLFDNPAVLSNDVVHCVIFAVTGILIATSSARIKFERYSLLRHMQVLNKTDVLTGVNNRNSYELAKEKYAALCKERLSCVFVDVNSLHDINNRFGHERGDNMLRFIAAGLDRKFGIENVYRIGGDEFLVFAVDRDPSSVQNDVDELRKQANDCGYHFAVGIADQSVAELQLDQLVQSAEIRMYGDKVAFYRRHTELHMRSGPPSVNDGREAKP